MGGPILTGLPPPRPAPPRPGKDHAGRRDWPTPTLPGAHSHPPSLQGSTLPNACLWSPRSTTGCYWRCSMGTGLWEVLGAQRGAEFFPTGLLGAFRRCAHRPWGRTLADIPQYLASGWDQTPMWQKSRSPGRQQGPARALQLPAAAFKCLSVLFWLGVLSEPQLSPLSPGESNAQVPGVEILWVAPGCSLHSEGGAALVGLRGRGAGRRRPPLPPGSAMLCLAAFLKLNSFQSHS